VSPKPPNILLILADDVGTGDIPYYWKTSSKVSMPNLDRLSSMGVTFMDAHSTPLCAPSRYMLLSGNYAHRGMKPGGSWSLTSFAEKNQFLPDQRSIADVLMNDAGYSTAMFGKWHLGGGVPMADGVDATIGVDKTSILTSTLHDWSKKIIDGPDDIGFATSFITTAGIQSSPYAFFRDGYLDIDPSDAVYWTGGDHPMPHGISKILKGKKQGEGDKNWDSSAYNMILVNETIKFVEDHVDSNTDKPFFAYVALGAVHAPHSPPYKYLDGEDVAGIYSDSHLDMLYEMDKVVGSLVTLIEDQGLQENTMIIFASDNGGLAGKEGTPISEGHDSSGDLRGSKSSIYEGGHRIPMIIRHDGFVPQNEERSHLVGLNDLYATICDLVGVDVPSFSAQDSISFADYLASGDPMDALREELATFAFKKLSGFNVSSRLQ
jgi:arylsulfatase A-like enzyme